MSEQADEHWGPATGREVRVSIIDIEHALRSVREALEKAVYWDSDFGNSVCPVCNCMGESRTEVEHDDDCLRERALKAIGELMERMALPFNSIL